MKTQSTVQLQVNSRRGYMVLMTTLIIGLIVSSLTIGALVKSSNSSSNTLIHQKHIQSLYLTRLCTEEALQQIRDNENFIGTSSMSFSDGYCEYSVLEELGTKKIRTSGSSQRTYTNLETVLSSTTPPITISSQEIVDQFTP